MTRVITNIKRVVANALCEIFDGSDRPAQVQRQQLQARPTDLQRTLQDEVCRNCPHEGSCIGCPRFEATMGESRHVACGDLLWLSQRALDYAYGPCGGLHMSKDAVAGDGAGDTRAKDGASSLDAIDDDRRGAAQAAAPTGTGESPTGALASVTGERPDVPADARDDDQDPERWDGLS